MTRRKFKVRIDIWPDYFEKFIYHCNDIAAETNLSVMKIIDRELGPHGQLIVTKTGRRYLRWDSEHDHLLFVLKWS